MTAKKHDVTAWQERRAAYKVEKGQEFGLDKSA